MYTTDVALIPQGKITILYLKISTSRCIYTYNTM